MANKSLAIPNVIPKDWKRLDQIVRKVKLRLGRHSSPTFTGLTLTGLTASRLIWGDADKALASKDLVDLVAGTANEITVADDASGGITIGIVDPLIVAKGGTGVATLTDHGILLGSGTGAVTPLGVATDGQLPIGSTGADPVLATITGTADQLDVTNAAGSITLSIPFPDVETDPYLNYDGNTFLGFEVAGAGNLSHTSGSTGYNNTILGYFAGNSLTTGYNNTGMGVNVLRANTTGYGNVGAGFGCLRNNVGGYQNTALGYDALFTNSTGFLNCAFGLNALRLNTDGYQNVAFGSNSLQVNVSGDENTVFGSSALQAHTDSFRNLAFGHAALYSLTDGDNNVAVGYKAGYNQTNISNLLIIDNQLRASAAAEVTNALVYGVFDAAVANQSLLVNGVLKSSYGAKFGDGGITDYSEFEIDGTLKFNNAATVWNDENIGGLTLDGPPPTLPSITTLTDNVGADTGIATRGFDVDELASAIIEVPHSYKEGSDLQFHIHWQGDAAPTGTDKVQWQLTYTVSQDGATLPPVTVVTVETNYDTQYERVISAITISDATINMGDQFAFQLKRIAATADEYGDLAKIFTVGLHVEQDTVGSRQILTK